MYDFRSLINLGLINGVKIDFLCMVFELKGLRNENDSDY